MFRFLYYALFARIILIATLASAFCRCQEVTAQRPFRQISDQYTLGSIRNRLNDVKVLERCDYLMNVSPG